MNINPVMRRQLEHDRNFWIEFSKRTDLTLDDIKKNEKDIAWDTLSCNPTVSLDIVEKYIHKLDMNMLIFTRRDKNPLPEWFIEKYENLMSRNDWQVLSYHYKNFSEQFIEKFMDKLEMGYIIQSSKLSEKFLRKHLTDFSDNNSGKIDLINVWWSWISHYQNLSEDFMREFKKYLDWEEILNCQKISCNFIREIPNVMKGDAAWWNLSHNKKISEQFIDTFAKELDWEVLSKYHKMSMPFIEKHADDVDWKLIYDYQDLNLTFIRKHAWRVSY